MKIYRLSGVPFREKWPYHKDNPNQINPDTMYDTTHVFDYFDSRLDNDLQKVIEEMFPGATPLGAGGLGLVYDIGNNKVLKLTSHNSEAQMAAELIVKQTYNMFPIIYDVMPISKEYSPYSTSSYSLWGIVMEKVKPLNREEILFIDMLPVEELEDMVKKQFVLPEATLPSERQLILAKELLVLKKNIERFGFNAFDMKGQNLGWKNGQLVQLDLGFLTQIQQPTFG